MGQCAPCAPGTYQDEPGQLACKACTPGHYCEEGALAALPCKQGSYSNATDLTSQAECTLADAGQYSASGSTYQTACSPGTSTPEAGMGVCTKCAGGKYQPKLGAPRCEACLPGHYCPEGASAPLPCGPATYSDRTDLTNETQCKVRG